VTLVVLLLSSAASAAAEAVHDPVILIPGLTASADAMSLMKAGFAASGWDAARVFTWTDSGKMTGDLSIAAGELAQEIDHVLADTGADKVVLVTWSAGALAARYYLKNIVSGKVSVFVSMAGPNHGAESVAACASLHTSCKQMMIGSSFLQQLNQGSEVPGAPAVKFQTQRSACDTNDTPTDTAELSGATNVLTHCITHFNFPADAVVLASVEGSI
jgi:triacylglycerol esterase/lipase EstA (alpha/beta hydrolase family)